MNVWRPWLDVENATKKVMIEIQKLVCVCVSGAMKSIANAMVVKTKAFTTANQLTQNELSTPKGSD